MDKSVKLGIAFLIGGAVVTFALVKYKKKNAKLHSLEYQGYKCGGCFNGRRTCIKENFNSSIPNESEYLDC